MKTVTYDETLWQLVPKQATQAMSNAAYREALDWETSISLDYGHRVGYQRLFRAMLAAAPRIPEGLAGVSIGTLTAMELKP